MCLSRTWRPEKRGWFPRLRAAPRATRQACARRSPLTAALWLSVRPPPISCLATATERPIFSSRTCRQEPLAAFLQERMEPKGTTTARPVSYTHLRAHETVLDLVCRLLLE